MDYFKEKRTFIRSTVIICKTLVSVDGIMWDEVDFKDISAGGLQFASSKKYKLSESLRINLHVYNFLSEFCITVEGFVKRIEQNNLHLNYAVQFINMDNYKRIQLDELINSKVTVMSY